MVGYGAGVAMADLDERAAARSLQLQYGNQFLREGCKVGGEPRIAEGDDGGGAPTRCHQLRFRDQFVREGHAVGDGASTLAG